MGFATVLSTYEIDDAKVSKGDAMYFHQHNSFWLLSVQILRRNHVKRHDLSPRPFDEEAIIGTMTRTTTVIDAETHICNNLKKY